SPSIKGMIGLSGTTRRPFCREIAVPVDGGLTVVKVAIAFRSHHPARVTRSSQKLWKSLWKSDSTVHVAPRQSAISSGLHHDGARTGATRVRFRINGTRHYTDRLNHAYRHRRSTALIR